MNEFPEDHHYKEHFGKLLVIPKNSEIQMYTKVLFSFDNVEFLNKSSFPEKLAASRGTWLEYFASDDGNSWKEDSLNAKSQFRIHLEGTLTTRSATSISHMVFVSTCPADIYELIYKICSGEVLEDRSTTKKFKPPASASSFNKLIN